MNHKPQPPVMAKGLPCYALLWCFAHLLPEHCDSFDVTACTVIYSLPQHCSYDSVLATYGQHRIGLFGVLREQFLIQQSLPRLGRAPSCATP